MSRLLWFPLLLLLAALGSLLTVSCGGGDEGGGAKSDEVRRFDEAARAYLKKQECEVAFTCTPEASRPKIHGTPEKCLAATGDVTVSEVLEVNKMIVGQCPELAGALADISRRSIGEYEQCVSDIVAMAPSSLCTYVEVTGSFYGPDDKRVPEDHTLAAIPSCKLAADLMSEGPESPNCKAAVLGGAFAPRRMR